MSLAATVIVIEAGRILLIQRADFKVWAPPGGAVEVGESAAQAAIREVQEETGIMVALTGLVGIYAHPQWIDHGHSVVFVARPVGGILRPQPGEADDVGYFAADALPERLVWWHRQPIADALSGVRGAVWRLDLRWPSDWMAPEEALTLRDQGDLPESLIRAAWEVWCREPQPGEQWREI